MLRGSELSVQYLSSHALAQNIDLDYLYAPLIPLVLLLAKDLHQDQSLCVSGALYKANEKQSLAQKDGKETNKQKNYVCTSLHKGSLAWKRTKFTSESKQELPSPDRHCLGSFCNIYITLSARNLTPCDSTGLANEG